MMWVGTDDLVASLRGDRVTLWRGAEPWWAHHVSDEWTGAAIGRRYVVLVVGSDAITRTDPVELSAYLTRRERVHAGLVKIRLRVTDQ